MVREGDVRNAIKELLVATGAFSDVWLTGLPQDCGQGASELTAAAIDRSRRDSRAVGMRHPPAAWATRVNSPCRCWRGNPTHNFAMSWPSNSSTS